MRLRSALVFVCLLVAVGCDQEAIQDGKKPAAGLTHQQAAAVLARVGDKLITVGDFAAQLERMGDMDRLRFQTPEKRKELLQQMIDLELLAQEARSRGFDKDPNVLLATRQILRDAVLEKARAGGPAPADILPAELAAYYEAHKRDYIEPERRRVSAIILADRARADEVAATAQTLDSAQKWGALYFEKSIDAPKSRDPQAVSELAGDLGLVGLADDPRAKNERIPEEVVKVVFALQKVGEVHPKAVPAGGRFYVVRLTGLSKGHVRTPAEADRSIRVAILQEKLREREATLEAELRKRFPVQVDDAALMAVELPKDGSPAIPDAAGARPTATAKASAEAVAPARP